MSELAGNLKLRLDSYRRRCVASSAIARSIQSIGSGSQHSNLSRSISEVAPVARSRNTARPADLSADVVDGARVEPLHEASPTLPMRAVSEAQSTRSAHISSVGADSPVARLRRTPQHSAQVSQRTIISILKFYCFNRIAFVCKTACFTFPDRSEQKWQRSNSWANRARYGSRAR